MINSVDGIIFLSKDNKILFIDQNAKDILDLQDKVVATEINEILHDKDFTDSIEEFKTTNNVVTKEFTSECYENKIFSILIEPASSDVKVGADEVKAILIIKDLTSLRHLETLEKDFITNVSHELRTPLTSIRMAAESLQMGAIADDKMKNKFLSNIQREADRLTRLVNELLVLAEFNNKPTLHITEFNPATMFQDVITTMEHHANLNDIQLIPDFSSRLPVIKADKDRIQQVILNLVDNAVKCNRPNGSVTLKAEPKDDSLEIQIIDTGIGIPGIDVNRIFDRFFRVDKARSRVTGGTGLGLSIVKDIIEAHGGNITVTSQLDVGTTFIITLPLVAKYDESSMSC